MTFIDFPEIKFPVQGIDDIPMPKMVRVKQLFEADKIDDVKSHLENELDNLDIDKAALKGKRIAITVGSRGIPENATMVRTMCDEMMQLIGC